MCPSATGKKQNHHLQLTTYMFDVNSFFNLKSVGNKKATFQERLAENGRPSILNEKTKKLLEKMFIEKKKKNQNILVLHMKASAVVAQWLSTILDTRTSILVTFSFSNDIPYQKRPNRPTHTHTFHYLTLNGIIFTTIVISIRRWDESRDSIEQDTHTTNLTCDI